jgi:hypothetical protein
MDRRFSKTPERIFQNPTIPFSGSSRFDRLREETGLTPQFCKLLRSSNQNLEPLGAGHDQGASIED